MAETKSLAHKLHAVTEAYRASRREVDRLKAQLHSEQEFLRVRTAALGRVVEQLEAVRKLHAPVKIDLTTDLMSGPLTVCPHCDMCAYPCPTARAAGVER